MSCFHPLKSFLIGYHDGKDGSLKETRKITGYTVSELVRSDGVIKPVYYGVPFYGHIEERFTDFNEIPCGHCLGCRLATSRQWADRMACEAVYYDDVYFVTLTYDPEHVPRSSFVNDDTGEVVSVFTLEDKPFIQKWLKRVRKKFGDGIRYFLCAEYGGKTGRPHYHVIFFGLHLNDLLEYKRTWNNDVLYTSEAFSDVWSDPVTKERYGFVVIAPANWQTMSYVSRYVTKKIGKTKDVDASYRDFGLVPEYQLMSRMPGLGRRYYDEHNDDLYSFDYFYLRVGDQSKRIYNPKYFDYLKEIEDPDFIEERKLNLAEKMESIKASRLAQTNRDWLSVLSDDEIILEDKLKKCVRKDV